jgi:oxaloacetate decarboxylase gamma subunit
MESSLVQQGVELMLFGMGTVFGFLACLVLITALMSALLQRLIPIKEEDRVLSSAKPAQQDEQLIAVISAAVHKYRSRYKP